MNDTEDSGPDTIKPPPIQPGEQALMDAFLQLDRKMERVLEMLGNMYALQLEDRRERADILDRIAALEAIPPPRPTILPPNNGHADG